MPITYDVTYLNSPKGNWEIEVGRDGSINMRISDDRVSVEEFDNLVSRIGDASTGTAEAEEFYVEPPFDDVHEQHLKIRGIRNEPDNQNGVGEFLHRVIELMSKP